MIEAVIFDLDGVIADTVELYYIATKRVADEIGVPFDRQLNQKLQGMSRQAMVEALLGESGGAGYFLALLDQFAPGGVADTTLQEVAVLVAVDVGQEGIPVSDLRHRGGADGDRAVLGGRLLDARGFEGFEHLCIEESDLPFNIFDGSLELRLLLAKREDFVDGLTDGCLACRCLYSFIGHIVLLG